MTETATPQRNGSWTDAVVTLLRLTQEGKLAWTRVESPSAGSSLEGDERADTTFRASYRGRTLILRRVLRKVSVPKSGTSLLSRKTLSDLFGESSYTEEVRPVYQ